ncbi:hypothetical protein GS982_01680 [Rhodococcus hoagii]|uniref:Uncharacterized protein n=1 Tax=Rhodococcus hoagii TaxID=43767 RepID=A0A9Q4ZIQ8_RHOHA|nr:hypothetical protein [Prescottella equi]NKT77308.1 hypothetical protein [Prescottella equi]NKZ81095.1 hypothetical protein [Prescottella equi]
MTEATDADSDFRKAVRTYVGAETDGGLVTDWMFVAAYVPADGADTTGYLMNGRTGQPEHASEGLLRAALRQIPDVYDDYADYPIDESDEFDDM